MYALTVGIFFTIIATLPPTSSLPPTPNTFQVLFPNTSKEYVYTVEARVSVEAHAPGGGWALTARLRVFSDGLRARMSLDNIKTIVQSDSGNSTDQLQEHVEFLKKPWEVGVCFNSIYVQEEPVWATNMKRALSFNFLYTEPKTTIFHIDEPCLHGNCRSVYSRIEGQTRKYSSLVDYQRLRQSSYEQSCLPSPGPENWYRPYANNIIILKGRSSIMTSERLYEVDPVEGLKSLEMTSEYQHRTQDHVLIISTSLSLQLEEVVPASSNQKLELAEKPMQYHGGIDNEIWSPSQELLKNQTYETLLDLAQRGIDANNIVRDPRLIHSLDFIDLLVTISQLNYTSLNKLYHDVLGTSYELETARNVFLEILSYARTEAAARLIKYLVVEQKAKLEDATLLSLIRKLPYNILGYSKSLLEELEVLTKLGPEYPREIRHAAILSFATLVHKNMGSSADQQYFDDIYDKYLRMYNFCPQYLDRLVWLQGLANIGKSTTSYLDDIHFDRNKDRHERLWAGLASLAIWGGSNLENTLPVLMNDDEHIQLRIMALHSFLSSVVGARDFLHVHSYIQNCGNDQLQRFWYSTVKSLEKNRFYHRYKSISYYIPFIASRVQKPDLKNWATNNYIVSQEPSLELQGPTFQLMTVGGPNSGGPELVIVEFSSGGEQPFLAAIYIIAEGLTSNLFLRLQRLIRAPNIHSTILEELKKMKVEMVEPEKVHIDIILKIQDKTVYATHIDQARFDKWKLVDLTKSVEDFIRFGSHINQQMVYYPIQIVKDFPTEIGTPINFHSSIVSFTSLRGNLTAPSKDDLTWKNDLHIRYQATSLTSLSISGPLHPSSHSARVQQTMVVHLPMKVDVSLNPVDRLLELIWTHPFQNGGLVMHSRTQFETLLNEKKELRTVTINVVSPETDNSESIFFDCDRQLTVPEITEMIKMKSKHFLTSLGPSQLILTTLGLINSPTLASCGLILPPKPMETSNVFRFKVKLDRLEWNGYELTRDLGFNASGSNDKWVKVTYNLEYYRDEEVSANETYLQIKGKLIIKQIATDDISLSITAVKSHQTYNVRETDMTVPLVATLGYKLLYHLGDDPRRYSNLSEYLNDMAANVTDEDVTYFGLRVTGITDVVVTMSSDRTNTSTEAVIVAPQSKTTMQVLEDFGVYQQCRIAGSTVHTFRGSTMEMPSLYYETLVLGECTEEPRYAITLSHPSGMIITTGEHSIYSTGKPVIGDDLSVYPQYLYNNNGTLITSRSTGIYVFIYDTGEHIVILTPQVYMHTACGVCKGQLYNRKS